MLYKIIVLPAKLVQKHISPAGTAPSTNIFTNPIMYMYSHHPIFVRIRQ